MKVHKTYRRCKECLLNVLRTSNPSPMSRYQEMLTQCILDPMNQPLLIFLRPFSTLKNNKQFLNQNQIKSTTNSVNEISTDFCFWLRLHTILYPNKQLPAQQKQKRQNKVRQKIRACNKNTSGTSLTSVWCLYCKPQTSHLTLPQRPNPRVQSSN